MHARQAEMCCVLLVRFDALFPRSMIFGGMIR